MRVMVFISHFLSSYELGSVYLQLCELFFMVDNPNREDLEELVDPSIFIERFTKSKYDVVFCLPFFFFFISLVWTSVKYIQTVVSNTRFIIHTLAGLLKGAHDTQTITKVIETTKNIIASMKRDWMQVWLDSSFLIYCYLTTCSLSEELFC